MYHMLDIYNASSCCVFNYCNMSVQVPIQTKWFTTLDTGIKFLLAVNDLMSFQVTIQSIWFTTCITGMKLIFAVNCCMFFQVNIQTNFVWVGMGWWCWVDVGGFMWMV